MVTNILKYKTLSKIGEGSYGSVFKAQNQITGEMLALKKIRVNIRGDGIPVSALREVSLLKFLDHPNIIKIYDVIHTGSLLVLAFEYVEQDFSNFILSHKNGISEKEVKRLLKQILSGIQYCHKNQIIHRDLKPSNILINHKFDIKIADFGLARIVNVKNEKSFSNMVATLWYRPPDVLLGSRQYSTSVDIWSAGCIFVEMLIGKPLFTGKNVQNQLDSIFYLLGTPSQKEWPEMFHLANGKVKIGNFNKRDFSTFLPGLSPEGLSLVSKMLKCDPEKRISSEEALAHPFFKNV